MIDKKNIWYVSLFSVILLLTIFYISMNNDDINKFSDTKTESNSDTQLVLNESTELVALRIQSDEERNKEIESYKETLLSETSSLEEKSLAYDKLIALNKDKGTEKKLEDLLKDKLKLTAFVKISNSNINVVIKKEEHSYELANQVIKTIQNEFKEDKYITVKFN